DFATRLRTRRRYPGPELSHILGLQLTWSADDIVKALEHAMRYDAYEVRAVERILEARYKPRRLAEQIADATRGHIREVMKGHPGGAAAPLELRDAAHGGSLAGQGQ